MELWLQTVFQIQTYVKVAIDDFNTLSPIRSTFLLVNIDKNTVSAKAIALAVASIPEVTHSPPTRLQH